MLTSTEDHRQVIAAVWAGDVTAAKTIVEHNSATLTARDAYGETLMDIVAKGVVWHRPAFHELAQWLVDQGAVCDIFQAARAGLLPVVKRLIAQSPGLLHAVDEEGRTPLMRAALVYGASDECSTVVDYLLDSGAVPDIWSASTYGWTTVVEGELAAHPSLVNERRQGTTPLGWAVRPHRNRQNAPVIVAALIATGADLEAIDTDEEDMTPLMHAAEWSEDTGAAAVLLDAGALVNATTPKGWTALDYAIDRGRSAMAAFLRQRGAVVGVNSTSNSA